MPSRNRGPVPFTRPLLPDLADVQRLLAGIWDRGVVTNGGPVQRAFERALVDRLRWPEAVVTASGSTALRLLCTAVRVSGEVIVPSFTHAATAQAVLSCGATPVPADIRPDDLTVDVDAVASLLTPRTSGILATHTFGHPADVEGLERLATRHGLALLFDAAAAVDVCFRNRTLARFGDGSAFSFHATKLLNSIEGGAVASRHDDVLDRVRSLRNFGMSGAPHADPRGMNGKSNELTCAVGLLALDLIEAEIRRRTRAVERYRQELADLSWVSFPTPREQTRYNHAYCVVRLRTDSGRPLAVETDRALHEAGIESRRYFAGPYGLAAPAGRTPHADAAREDVLCLPLWGDIPDSTIDRICREVRSVLHSCSRQT